MHIIRYLLVLYMGDEYWPLADTVSGADGHHCPWSWHPAKSSPSDCPARKRKTRLFAESATSTWPSRSTVIPQTRVMYRTVHYHHHHRSSIIIHRSSNRSSKSSKFSCEIVNQSLRVITLNFFKPERARRSGQLTHPSLWTLCIVYAL